MAIDWIMQDGTAAPIARRCSKLYNVAPCQLPVSSISSTATDAPDRQAFA